MTCTGSFFVSTICALFLLPSSVLGVYPWCASVFSSLLEAARNYRVCILSLWVWRLVTCLSWLGDFIHVSVGHVNKEIRIGVAFSGGCMRIFNGYSEFIQPLGAFAAENPQFRDDLESSVLWWLLSELKSVEVIKPANLLSPKAESALMRHIRSPLDDELVPISKFWYFKRTIYELSSAYRSRNDLLVFGSLNEANLNIKDLFAEEHPWGQWWDYHFHLVPLLTRRWSCCNKTTDITEAIIFHVNRVGLPWASCCGGDHL